MANVKLAHAASSALTITLASLGTSSTFVAGRESNEVDNSSNLYLDYLIGGKITVGTGPTANTSILVQIIGLLDDAPVWPDVFDGTDSAETVSTTGTLGSIAKVAAAILCEATTSDQTRWFGPVSIASLFGGVLPKKFVVFVSHNTGVNLNSTGSNHAIYITPVYATVA